VPDAKDTAMDFLYGLDNNHYAKFKAELVNNLQKGIFTQRTTAGVKRYDESFDWHLMNLSVNTALQDFG
jgi:hypothetical protein